MKKNKDNVIGIWGLGKTGKSLLSFFYATHSIIVCDANTAQLKLTKKTFPSIIIVNQNNLEQFFSLSDIIIASPGIDISPYKHLANFVSELDLFQSLVNTPIIAITGSVGKTTTTTMLHNIFTHQQVPHIVAGNIGTPLFDLIHQAQLVDYVLLECSSFQLEHCKTFSPHLAIITNVVKNHLDRHKSMQNYIKAKLKIVQQNNTTVLVPTHLKKVIGNRDKSYFFSAQNNFVKISNKNNYFIENNLVIKKITVYKTVSYQTLVSLQDVQLQTFDENKLIILAILDLLKLPLNFPQTTNQISHRTELVAIINGTTFINDSKATTPTATLAAINNYRDKQIILIIGGLSKGVNRKNFIQQLTNYKNIIYIICFGYEAEQLTAWCNEYHLPTNFCANLLNIFQQLRRLNLKEKIVLFSPSGSSFDLYDNFEKRGDHFKKLTKKFL
jgi:UDP-N-acetylmuramoylalanine--D-glutamate ligase